jgi:hypothetical protein
MKPRIMAKEELIIWLTDILSSDGHKNANSIIYNRVKSFFSYLLVSRINGDI